MAVSTITMYASAPTSSIHDFEIPSTSASTTSTSSARIIGGLTRLLSSSTATAIGSAAVCGGSGGGDDGGSLGSSFRYGGCSPLKRDYLQSSPVSVLTGPVSGSGLGSRSFDEGGIGLGFMVDEVEFNLGDDLVVEELLSGAQLRNKIFCDEFVVKAFYQAELAHRGQMRASGHLYLQHCVETALLLAAIGANSTVVAAGLLHDSIDDSFLTYDYILAMFGQAVADLVQGVSKLSNLSKLARDNGTAYKIIEADRLHTMFLAMADARAVLIKLADRLHNMMTLEALPVHKQHRFAKETLEIFAPLANRLGISTWKEQLENLCFMHLFPNKHQELSSKLDKTFDQAVIESATEKLDKALKKEKIFCHELSGRHKSIYSIYRKMLKKKLTMDEVHDIHGLRLIVENEDDCFKALKLVHQLWPEVPGKLKNYIDNSKINGYRSLHTVVVGEGMVPLEVQIRTHEMHLQAEFGFAAHWRYKEGECKHSSYVLQMVEWARWAVTWHCENMNKDQSSGVFADSIRRPCKFPTHSEDCPYSYKPQSNQDGPVFVILIDNEKVSLLLSCCSTSNLYENPMSVQEFPTNSTMLDLLERTGHGSPRWTPYGFPVKEDLRPRLNHEPVSDPTCRLKMGDVIELTPAIPDKSLVEYREEIQRMYNRGRSVSVSGVAASRPRVVGWRN
ncbi:hypothetical protein KSS87_009885 [Heliosperma pusillum]|nr:hypothetical protein KSS87_009885 [Heliosperma pusillum]